MIHWFDRVIWIFNVTSSLSELEYASAQMVGKFQLTGEKAWRENSSLGPPSVILSFRTGLPGQIIYGGGGKGALYPCWEILASWNKGKPIGSGGAGVACLLPQRLKIPSDNNAHCQEEQEIGELGLNFSGLDPGPRRAWLMQPQQGSFLRFPPPCSSSLFWKGQCHWDMLPGRDIFCFPFFHLYLCRCIQSSLYTADIAEGKAFTRRHWFESTEYGHSRHLWLVDGISRLWESMFHCGVPEKGKMGRWMLGSRLNYAWRPDGHVKKAVGTGSDGVLQVRIGRLSQQAGRSLDCPIIYRGSRFKYFSQARWEKPAQITSVPFIRYVWVLDKSSLAFCIKRFCCKIALLHQCRLSPGGIWTDAFCC